MAAGIFLYMYLHNTGPGQEIHPFSVITPRLMAPICRLLWSGQLETVNQDQHSRELLTPLTLINSPSSTWLYYLEVGRGGSYMEHSLFRPQLPLTVVGFW